MYTDPLFDSSMDALLCLKFEMLHKSPKGEALPKWWTVKIELRLIEFDLYIISFALPSIGIFAILSLWLIFLLLIVWSIFAIQFYCKRYYAK